MKSSLIPFVFVFLTVWCSAASQTRYEDQPMGLTAAGAEVIRQYEAKARATLDEFDREFENAGARTLYVVTKIHEGDFFEQIYVLVTQRDQDGYQGKIASEPTGRVPFTRGAPIHVATADVADWLIVLPDGEEHGNLTGKAMDALQAGSVVFIISMKPEDGRFTHFKVVSIRNPKTQQEIGAIVPDEVVARVEAESQTRFGKLKSDGDEEKFQFILVSFPQWEFIR